jgi:hypothetical protein
MVSDNCMHSRNKPVSGSDVICWVNSPDGSAGACMPTNCICRAKGALELMMPEVTLSVSFPL